MNHNTKQFTRLGLVLLALILIVATGGTAQAATTDLFFSEYTEGSGYNKALEIYNATGAPVDLSTYTLELYSNGSATASRSMALSGIVNDGDVFVIAHQDADAALTAVADQLDTPNNVINFNGDDAVVLKNNSVVVDAIGQTGFDPGSQWGTGVVSTQDNTIRRKADVCAGETDASDAYDPIIEWDGYANNTFDDFGVHTANCGTVTPTIIINELDADQVSTDNAEFIELYDGGVGNTDLSGLVLVLMNGSDDASYDSFDLDGLSTDADGYFVLCGDAANVANCDLDVSPNTNLIQNGADAAALYSGNAADFPNDTPATVENLLDAIVYDTDDTDDAGLLILLNAGQPQVNERDGGDGTGHSNQRCDNGTGGARNTDTYTQETPSPGATNTCTPPPPPTGFCGDPATFIHTIQGSGASSPEEGNNHTIEGVIVGDFQTSANLRGFFIQEEDTDADANPMTSEGIFVYDGSIPAVDVAVGDVVRVNGQVVEYFDLTELTSVSSVIVCSTSGIASAATITLPVANVGDWEYYEGMLINIPQTLYATGNYTWGRYGEVDLSVNDRLYNPTNVAAPGAPADAVNDLNDRSRIQLEDGSTAQNPSPVPYLGVGNTLRAGDTIPNLTAVVHYAYDFYEVHPTEPIDFTRANARSATPPDVGGTVKVASFNVLNYFTTLDENGPICGPSGTLGCRGADSAFEFTRQRDKIISAITAMDADIIGLMEMENHPTDDAMQDLVNGLNDATAPGTYAYLATGPIGTDAIKVAYIYKVDTVTPVGPYAVLDSSVDPTFIDTKNRPALAQTFQENLTGATFTAVVNHLKSKGSDCDDVGDPDAGDQQGNCNLTRTAAATALVNWLATDPTGSGDSDFLIMGDLNAYALEDPITAIESAGYTNLIKSLLGTDAYSYVFFGEAGYLDHALANNSLTGQVSGVTEWHINSDEPSALNYNDYNQAELYQPDAYAASDHDPVIIGLDLNAPPVCSNAVASVESLWPANHKMVSVDVSGVTDPDGDAITITIDGIMQDEAVLGNGSGNTSPDGQGVGTSAAEVRAEREGGGNGRYYHISFTANDGNSNTCIGTVSVSVPVNQGKKGAAIDDGPLYDSTQ